MKRNVYLHEYESMTIKQRVYLVRRNFLSCDWSRFKPINPMDWSLRVVLRGLWNLISFPLYLILYVPLLIYHVKTLKNRYVNTKDKSSTYHSDLEVLDE